MAGKTNTMERKKQNEEFSRLLKAGDRRAAIELAQSLSDKESWNETSVQWMLIACTDYMWPAGSAAPFEFCKRCTAIAAEKLERPCWELEKPIDSRFMSFLFSMLGGILIELKRQDLDAIRVLETAFELNTESVTICRDLAYVNFRNDFLGESVKWRERALDIDPVHLLDHLDCAYMLRRLGEFGSDGTLLESGSFNGPALFYIGDSGVIRDNLPHEGHVLNDLSPYYCIEAWARKVLDDIGKGFSETETLEDLIKMQEPLIAWLSDTDCYSRHAPKIDKNDTPEKIARKLINALDETFHGNENFHGFGDQ
jgi:hypothetical protein